MVRCLNTTFKYGKVTNIEIKWSIINKSVMIIIFEEFIDHLIDYPIISATLPAIFNKGDNITNDQLSFIFTLSMPGKNFTSQYSEIFSYIPRKTDLDISYILGEKVHVTDIILIFFSYFSRKTD